MCLSFAITSNETKYTSQFWEGTTTVAYKFCLFFPQFIDCFSQLKPALWTIFKSFSLFKDLPKGSLLTLQQLACVYCIVCTVQHSLIRVFLQVLDSQLSWVHQIEARNQKNLVQRILSLVKQVFYLSSTELSSLNFEVSLSVNVLQQYNSTIDETNSKSSRRKQKYNTRFLFLNLDTHLGTFIWFF